MGDLGSDTGSTSISLMTKALEAFLRMIEKLFDAWRNNPQRKLAKQELKLAKNEAEKAEVLRRLNGKVGYVNYKDLRRSGDPLRGIEVFMTKADMKDFSALCKRYGVQFSGMTEKENTKRDESGKKTYEIICREKDLETVLQVFERMNDEKQIVEWDKQIAALEAKGENMTEQDKVDVAHLQEQKAALQKKYCDKVNDSMAKSVIEQAVTGEAKDKLTLNEALDRLTGRQLDKDIVSIVADANDPSKYIKCYSYNDTYKDQVYMKTEYEVMHGDKSVFKTHDGRFDGRPKDYWNNQKQAIQEKGEFSGTFFKFHTMSDYQQWAEKTRVQNEQELSTMNKEVTEDFDKVIGELKTQLNNNGAEIKDDVVVNKETGEPLAIAEGMSAEEKAIVAESIVIGKQINNYKELASAELERSMAEADVLTTDDKTEERTHAEAVLSDIESRIEKLRETEKNLITERKEINAVQAEQEVRNPELTQEQEIEYLPEDKAKIEELESKIEAATIELKNGKDVDISSMKNELAQLKSKASENARNNRDEKANDKTGKQMTMEEAKREIAEKEKAKSLGGKEKSAKERGDKTASKSGKGHSER